MASDYDSTRSDIPWSVKLLVIVVLAIAVWLAVGLIFATLRIAFAIAGYVIVGFFGYEIGKWVGRNSGPDRP